MNRIPTRSARWPHIEPTSWLLGCITSMLFFGAIALASDDTDADLAAAAQLVDAEVQRERDLVLLQEVGQIAREAHAQGMREALASVKGTPDAEVLQRSCARLWGMEQGQ